MLTAIQLLRENGIAGSTSWPRLRDVVLPSNKNDTVSGFPFLSWYGDYTGCSFRNWKGTHSIPLFTNAASVDCNFTFPFPTYQIALHALNNPREWDNFTAKSHATYPWQQKIPQILWRGSLTGKIVNATQKCPRWNLVQMIWDLKRNYNATMNSTLQKPFLFDVAATRLPNRHKNWEQSLSEVGELVSGIKPMDDFQKYRGILDIDGNSWSSRFSTLLCYNSVVLKVEPRWVDYFTFERDSNDEPELQPWKHYIPVKADFSDLVELAAFVADPMNDRFLMSMVKQANNWCRRNAVKRAVAIDMLNIWERYIVLLDIANPHWREEQWTFAKAAIFASSSPLDMIAITRGSDVQGFEGESVEVKK